LVEGKLSTERKTAAGVLPGSVFAPILHSLCINDALPRHLKLILLFSQTIPVFTRRRNTIIVFSVNCNAGWNIKINERKTPAIYFSR
jgi:hypothetical protein